MEKYKIIKELGYGMFGTVYKIEYKNKFFAMKIEHILDDDINKNIKSSLWERNRIFRKFC
jgi:serine/threonine protein kinase